MAVSKRRKPKRLLPPHVMPRYQAVAHFKQLAQMDGVVFPSVHRIVEPTGPQQTAFANAWHHARAHGLDYAEGVVWRDDTGWLAHAWCVTSTGHVVEVTEGFTAASGYKGWVLDRGHAETIIGDDAPARPVIETGLSLAGHRWTDLIQQISKHNATKDAS